LKDINYAAAVKSPGSHETSSICQNIYSIHNKYFPQSAPDNTVSENLFSLTPAISFSVEAMILSLDHDLAAHSEILKPIFEDIDKKYVEQQLKKELEIANLTAQIHHLEALNLNLQKQNSHFLFKSLTVDEFARKNAKKCDEHEAVIRKLQEEITTAHHDLKDRDAVLLHCLRDINIVRSEYATLEMERKLQYQASERDLAQRMHLSSEQVVEIGEKLQNFRDVLAQKDSCLDDFRSRCDFLTSENGIMMKKMFALESLCSDTQSALSRCKGELDIVLLEKQMLTKIDEQRRLSLLQSSDSYHSQLELDYKASQETIDELRNKCDTYQASWFQFEKKTREDKREWQQTKEHELRLMMEVSINERVGVIEAEIKVFYDHVE
jgi:peptidoglycan hydrolase CwlO-like protein